MRILLILILAISCIKTFVSCEKITNTTWVYYDESWCANPWGTTNLKEDERITNVRNYLKDRKIKVFKVSILSDGTIDPCDGCHCKSGTRVHANIKTKDLDKAIQAGFYK
jgi:hypothetical protein